MVSKIVDQFGQPLDMGTVETPQTSQLAWLQKEFAAHPSRGLTPSALAQILVESEQGDPIRQYELFEDIEEKDTHVASEMAKRRRAILGLQWSIEPPRNPTAQEKKYTEALRELILDVPDFEDMLFDITDAIGKGFAALEIEWAFSGGVWLPKSITHRPQSWFRFYRGYRQEIRLRDNSAYGAPLNPFGWIVPVHRAKSGYLERAALFRVLVWPYLFKNYSVGDLAEFLEIYGMPLRLGKYPSGANPQEKATLLRALVNLGHNAAGIIPDSMAINFTKASEGKAAEFGWLIDWCERSESKAILGATLTSQADRGSNTNALGNVHNEVRKDLRDSDAKQIAAALSRDLVYAIAALNGYAPGGIQRAPQFTINTRDPEDLKLYAESLPTLVNVGMKIPAAWAREKLMIPTPETGEEILVPLAQPAAQLPGTDIKPTARASAQLPAAAVTAQNSTPRPATTLPLDPPSKMLDQVDAALRPAMTDWLAQVRDVVEQAQTLDDVREGLLKLLPNLSLDQYANAMQQALAAAALAGRYEILREAGAGGA